MRCVIGAIALLVSVAPATADVSAVAATSDLGKTFEAHAASATVAAMNALHECRATGEVCEITRVAEHAVHRAVELKPRTKTPVPLWRFQSTTATVFVGGSMHLLKETLLPLPRPFLDAFEESSVLAVEVDPTGLDGTAMAALAQRYLMIQDGKTQADVLPAATWQRLRARLADFGLPLEQVARLKPGFLAVELGRLRFQTLGYLPHLGVEQQLIRQIGDRALHQIETAEQQFELISSQPIEVQVAMLEQVIGPLDVIEAEVATLVRAWLVGDLDALIEAMRDDGHGVPGFDAFMRRMLDDRNLTMASAAARYLDGDQTVFVLVGAGHLGGDSGLVATLQRWGETRGWIDRQYASDGSFVPLTGH